MKRTFVLIACLCTLVVAGCTSDSKLPSATGKGSIRALNTIPASPDIRFLIEERLLGAISYQRSTAYARYDDFEYNFNFELFLPGYAEPDRILTITHKLETGRDDIFVLTGDPANPTVTIWSTQAREWSDGDTVFQYQFAHTIVGQDDIDVYLDEAVEPAVLANKVATLSYGGVSNLSDTPEGTYIVTVTEAGDTNAILYQSSVISFVSQTTQVISLLAGNENDTSSIILNVMGSAGGDRKFPDASAVQTVRLIHASRALQASDIYDDDLLTSMVFSNLIFGNATGDIEVSDDPETYYYTPTGSIATILHQADYQVPTGRHANLLVVGAADDYSPYSFLPDRASVSAYAKVQLFNAALETTAVSVYIKDADDPLVEEDFPLIFGLIYPAPSPIQPLLTGSYDVYVTPVGEKTVLAGPLRLDVVNGDVIDLIALDTDTPGVVELKVLPAP